MTNYMPEIAKMLGVELDEEFEIVRSSTGEWIANAYITNDRLCYSKYNPIYKEFSGYTLEWLLKGSYTIKQKTQEPWKPRGNEKYWYVTPEGYCCNAICLGDWVSVTLYKIGNCYRTKEEAEANRDKWVEFYKSDEVLEI